MKLPPGNPGECFQTVKAWSSHRMRMSGSAILMCLASWCATSVLSSAVWKGMVVTRSILCTFVFAQARFTTAIWAASRSAAAAVTVAWRACAVIEDNGSELSSRTGALRNSCWRRPPEETSMREGITCPTLNTGVVGLMLSVFCSQPVYFSTERQGRSRGSCVPVPTPQGEAIA